MNCDDLTMKVGTLLIDDSPSFADHLFSRIFCSNSRLPCCLVQGLIMCAIFLSVSCWPWRWLWVAQPTEPHDSEGELYLPLLPVTNQLYNIQHVTKSGHNQSQHQPQGCDAFIKINWAPLLLCQGSWNIPCQCHLCGAQLQRLPSMLNGVSMSKMVWVDKAHQVWPDIRYALLPPHGEPWHVQFCGPCWCASQVPSDPGVWKGTSPSQSDCNVLHCQEWWWLKRVLCEQVRHYHLCKPLLSFTKDLLIVIWFNPLKWIFSHPIFSLSKFSLLPFQRVYKVKQRWIIHITFLALISSSLMSDHTPSSSMPKQHKRIHAMTNALELGSKRCPWVIHSPPLFLSPILPQNNAGPIGTSWQTLWLCCAHIL